MAKPGRPAMLNFAVTLKHLRTILPGPRGWRNIGASQRAGALTKSRARLNRVWAERDTTAS